MRKNDKKQRRSLLFSTAVVVTGCLLTAFYVNQEMPKSEYEVDLSQLSAEQKQEDLAGDMRTGDAGVAKVTGNDVQNTIRRFISVLWKELRSVPVPKAW